MAEEIKTEKAKELMKAVYADGFNIYQCLNRLKKQLKLRVDFPPDAIIWTCESYFKEKPKDHWPWFLEVFKRNSQRYFSNQKEQESKTRDKRSTFTPESIKKILKGM